MGCACRGRNVAHVAEDKTLDEVLKTFMTCNNHMLIAHVAQPEPSGSDALDISSMEVTGLITLEDVMETLIQVHSQCPVSISKIGLLVLLQVMEHDSRC